MSNAALEPKVGINLRRYTPVFSGSIGLWFGIGLLLLLIALSVTVQWIRPWSASQISGDPFIAPNRLHWLGTDDLGRDYFVRLCVAARISLLTSGAAAGIALVIGTLIGLVSALGGKWFDAALMGAIDLALAIPSILVALVAVAVFGANPTTLVVVLALTSVPPFARVVRAQCREVKIREFVQSARISNVSTVRIALRHILPNVRSVILVQLAVTAATVILVEAGLSYLGLGIQPPTPSWGNMVFASEAYMKESPWLVLGPIGALILASSAWGLIGEAFRTPRGSGI